VAIVIYIPTNSVEVFLFPISSPAFVVACVIDDSHFDWGELESQGHFMAKDVEHFFMYLSAICISSFEKCLFSSFAHLLSGLLTFLEVSVLSSCIFWLLTPCQMYSWQRFSPIL
jgi:hypothetical protein